MPISHLSGMSGSRIDESVADGVSSGDGAGKTMGSRTELAVSG